MIIDKMNRKELFAQEYLSNGRNGTLAYQKFYPNANYDTASVNSWKLLKSDKKVIAIVKKEEQQLCEKFEVSKDMLINLVMDTIKQGQTNEDGYLVLKGVELLNKMCGLNQPDKTEITHRGIIINYVQPMEIK